MKLDDRNKIHAAIEEACEDVGLTVETGGGYLKHIGDVEDADEYWDVPVIIRIPKKSIL